jgi:hypothetical protein
MIGSRLQDILFAGILEGLREKEEPIGELNERWLITGVQTEKRLRMRKS